MSVSGAATASFLYDGDGARVKGTVGGVTTYYPNQYYEVAGGVVKKYYYAGANRVAMNDGGAIRTLLGDHLGSTAVTVAGTTELGEVRYKAFGATRFTSGTTPTTYRYTGQREESSLGLYYYGARWYDPSLGRFVQADTIIPNAADARAYDRYAYTYNNPLRYTDPTGHDPGACMALGGAPPLAVGCQIGSWLIDNGPLLVQLASQWADKVPALTDRLFNSTSSGEQAAQSASNAGNSAGPGGFDPNDPFRNAGEAIRQGVETLRRQIESPTNYTTGRYGAQAHLSRAEYYQRQGLLQSVNPVGEGTIDLVLTNNTGVEVKYNQAQYVLDNVNNLARQLNNFKRLNLSQIAVEFVQTKGDPVTEGTLASLRHELAVRQVDLSNIVFRIVSNPGIPE